jgi:hypothetical protein
VNSKGVLISSASTSNPNESAIISWTVNISFLFNCPGNGLYNFIKSAVPLEVFS